MRSNEVWRRAARTLRAGMLALLATLAAAATVHAQPFPSHPISLTIPYAAGGPTDAIGRILADHMSRTLGQPIVIDTVVGASGTVASDKVAKSAPDGYTILLNHLALLAAPSLYSNLRYDTRTAFAPVGLVNSGPMVLVARKTIPANTPAELFAWLKANGGKTTAGHAGVGTNSHLCTVLLAQALGIKITNVAYRGAAPALNDTISGQIDILFDQTTNSVPQILAGNVKAFFVTTPERSSAIPNVPTAAEAGMPNVQFSVWHGLYVAAGTPEPIVARLNAALQAAVADPDVQAKFAAVGTVAYPPAQRSVAAHAALFAQELDRIAKVIAAAGINAERGK